jgi:spermidine synthase
MVNQDKQVGHAAGIISMLGSLGSFVGTFISGFFLLSAFGVTSIFLGTGLLLIVLALMAFWMARSPAPTQAKAAILCILAAGLGSQVHAAADAQVIHQRNSFYHQIEVTEHGLGSDEQRFLKLDSTMEGGMRVHDGALVLDYQNFWRLAELHDDLKLERALFIGAGAFGMPEELSRMHPAAHVDVVEIDPAVIEVGRKFFKLDEHPSVHAHADDARRFLRRSSGGYDLIFGDAYNGVRHIPAHLVTKEFFQEVKAKLSARGVFLMNVITAVNGDKAELLGHMLATLRSVFPHLEVFAVSGAGNEPQNIILLAANETWKPWLEDKFYLPGTPQAGLAGRRIFERQLPAGGRVFTDDWNPVDAVIARQLLVK